MTTSRGRRLISSAVAVAALTTFVLTGGAPGAGAANGDPVIAGQTALATNSTAFVVPGEDC